MKSATNFFGLRKIDKQSLTPSIILRYTKNSKMVANNPNMMMMQLFYTYGKVVDNSNIIKHITKMFRWSTNSYVYFQRKLILPAYNNFKPLAASVTLSLILSIQIVATDTKRETMMRSLFWPISIVIRSGYKMRSLFWLLHTPFYLLLTPLQFSQTLKA